MKKNLISFLLFASIITTVFAQDNFFKDYVTKNWKAEDGIPGNSITDIIQSKDGYIYFGTYGGLIRFDGVEFVTINKLYDPKYNFISTRSIMQDSKGNIWVGSNDEGAFCITPKQEVFSFSLANGLPNNSVRSFCEDEDGNIWIGTASGIACVSENLELYTIPGFETVPENNNFIVSQLYCDTAGRIWIVTKSEKGLFVYSNKKFSVFDGIKCVKKPIITTISQDSTGAFWFGIAPHYAVKFSGEEEKLYNLGTGVQKGTAISCIFQDSSKNYWFALDTGITILHDGQFSYFDRKNGLADENVVKIIEDREKNIWIATDRGGIEKLNYGKFETTQMKTTVNAIAQDTFRDVVWLAGDDGLYCYKNNRFIQNKITEYCKNIRIRHVSLTKDGALLVCTYEKLGQLKFNLDGTINQWTREDGLAGDRIRVAEELSDGNLYVGTTTGLSIINQKTNEITNIVKNSSFDNDYIMCIYEDSEKRIWIGTDGGGVFVFKDGQIIQKYTKANGLAGNVIFKICNLRNNEIWICTGTGVTCINNNRISKLDSSNGFGTDGVFQVMTDYSNRLWGTSNRGIFFIKLDDIDDVINGKKNTLNSKYCTRLDGITSDGVTSTSLSMKDNLGRIWFTLIDGFAIYDPIKNTSNVSTPEVQIQEIEIDSEKVPITSGKIILEPKTKRINIKYTGISFISSEQVSFKTKLSGFDKEYSEWTHQRMASYTNLKPGTYNFSVIAQNGDEVQSDKTTSLIIIKKPYIWQRPWFIILIALTIISVVTFFIILKINSYKREEKRIEQLSIEVIQALVGIIDAKDKYTNGHSNRVAEYSLMLSNALGLSTQTRKEVFYAALLHDIGKIGIPDSIINKPASLSSEEYEVIKSHPVIGSQILSSISSMKDISKGARNHHERYDGTGYPDKLKATDIPLTSRIICVADAYDAMTSNRSYRKYMTQDKVRDELEKNKGTQFDPEIVEKMIEIIDSDKNYLLHE